MIGENQTIRRINMKTFDQELKKLEKSDLYPFHMPGHKRRIINEGLTNPYLRDITEIDGYDNLHDPTDFILEEEKFGAALCGAEESFYLVNGSTCGILSAIMTVAGDSKKLLVARNCHKAVFNGLYLANAKGEYLYPKQQPDLPFQGSVSPDEIKNCLDQDSYAGIIITSPTYQGILSDIAGICDLAHQYGIPVIVDEAHGAHLSILEDEYFPKSAVFYGADIVIQSVHKTLPAMTQTALLHVQGNLVDRNKLKQQLTIFQTSSPSYVLMESISDALHYCEESKVQLTQNYKQQLISFYNQMEDLRCMYLYSERYSSKSFAYAIDPGKLVICIKKHIPFSGKELNDLLRKKYRLQMEMAEEQYVIAMTGIMDTEEGFQRLSIALKEIDEMLCGISATKNPSQAVLQKSFLDSIPGMPVCLTIKEAVNSQLEKWEFSEAIGRISGEYLYLYPPGVPILVPGEKITKECIDYITEKKKAGLSIQGPVEYKKGIIACVSEKEEMRIKK